MAANLFLLKRRIKTANNIAQIAKAMEMVSASKIKRAQIAVENNKPYAHRISQLTRNLLAKTDLETYTHPYLTEKKTGKRLLLIISSDKGLAGALNTNLHRKLNEYGNKSDYTITLGRRGEMYANRLGHNLIAAFPMGTSLPSYSLVYQLIKLIQPYIMSGEVTHMDILFSEFVSFFSQIPKVESVLPIHTASAGESEEEAEAELPYLVEPDIPTLLDSLLPHYLEVKLYQTLVEAYTSEQAARMIAMQNAKNNARDVASSLTLTYNKIRQEKITNEILDLSNAALTA